MSFLQSERIIEVQDQQEMVGILGRNDELLRVIKAHYESVIVARGNVIVFSGEDNEVGQIETLFKELLFLYRQGMPLTTHDVRYSIGMIAEGRLESLHRMYADTIIVTNRGRQVKAKTLGQWDYVETIKRSNVTIGIGPAGTGKTYLAVALAVKALKNKEVERIVLTRPAVEAGEKLGFLPGDMQDKVDPYLRPLYDALYDMLGSETFQKYVARGTIEVAPLAYMRGRTLNDSFIILDEAQNTTPEQMKMFLTRFGFGSKMVITGDITQIDLPNGKNSGLKQAAYVLQQTPGVGIIRFGEADVVRHEIVAAIIRAYENKEVERIVLTRPAVEAGEKLGFLPGDMQDKVDPYLRPLYDALYDMLGSETFQKYVARGTIEVAPLAYMRGRTLNDSFIILDEAQNTTPEQMKMFLTRFGFGSKMVITGDITQIDLPNGKNSGLKQAAYVLQQTPGVGIIRFGEADVVRHEIVAAIIRAYENYDSRRQKQREADNDNNAGK